ncbi:hypothetical protein [Marinomonas algarum]|uniref:Uncharacterized protein n=1 Tax=Marinomonas algarum TaxID=2883105 RepID=A0A9X1IPF6_9GAMM|nr:hypothetical protein [Marinomonas algarum]MCB5162619.1 hypothetical protein [Marinomonas algarum]
MNKIENQSELKKTNNKMLEQAGLAQCIFVIVQSVAFPELGMVGAILAAQCALMPWSVPIAKEEPVTAVAMSISSVVITPFFSMFCMAVINAFL